ncbi:MAG TPA: glycosyltransferase [Dongiaceae bacterium]|jgi:hypothetical protein|nr:glycosyltransferase [Dongiaceae bacterium]
MDNIARVFVGTDRSQMIGVKVLEYSIRKHSSIEVDVRPMVDLALPEPADPRHAQRTGFSFSRFAIPQLAGYRGKAVYLDADMLVFKDFMELWAIPFDGAKVIIQEELPTEAQKSQKGGAPSKRIKQCSVMLLDCGRLNWDVNKLIADLGVRYSYEDLMYHLCILEPDEIAYRIPFAWNSLERYEAGTTRLLHYTDMHMQPWVAPENPNGYLWIGYLKEMLNLGLVTQADIEEEIALGHARPSLALELAESAGSRPLTEVEVKGYKEHDTAANFVRHKAVYDARRRHKQAIEDYERKLPTAPCPASVPPAAAVASKGMMPDWLGHILALIRG